MHACRDACIIWPARALRKSAGHQGVDHCIVGLTVDLVISTCKDVVNNVILLFLSHREKVVQFSKTYWGTW